MRIPLIVFIWASLLLALTACNPSAGTVTSEQFQETLNNVAQKNLKSKILDNGWYHVSNDSNDFSRLHVSTNKEFYVDPIPIVLPSNFARAEEFDPGDGGKGLTVFLDDNGTVAWSIATEKAMQKNVLFILDNKIISAPKVVSHISGGITAFWSNELTTEQWKAVRAMVK